MAVQWLTLFLTIISKFINNIIKQHKSVQFQLKGNNYGYRHVQHNVNTDKNSINTVEYIC